MNGTGLTGFGMLPPIGTPTTTAPGWGALTPAMTMASIPSPAMPSAMPGGAPQPGTMTSPVPGMPGAPGMTSPMPGVPGAPGIGQPGNVSPLAAVIAGLAGGAVGPAQATAAALPPQQQAALLGPQYQTMSQGGGGLAPADTLAALLAGGSLS